MMMASGSGNLGPGLLRAGLLGGPATASAPHAAARFKRPLPPASRCAAAQPALSAAALVTLATVAAVGGRGWFGPAVTMKALGCGGAVALAVLGLLHLGRARVARVTHGRAAWATSALTKMPSLLLGYRPPAWLPGGVLQTVATNMMRVPSGPALRYRREDIPMPELQVIHWASQLHSTWAIPPTAASQLATLRCLQRPAEASCCPETVPAGLVSLDWLDHDGLGAAAAADLPIVLVIPGLTGDSSVGYVARLCCALRAGPEPQVFPRPRVAPRTCSSFY